MNKTAAVLIGLLLWAVPVAAQTTRVSDNFTNAGANEALSAETNHDPQTAPNICDDPCWSESVDSLGTLQFNADAADDVRSSGSSNGNRLLWIADELSVFGSANYDVSIRFAQLLTSQVDGDHFCVFGRLGDSTHGYGACVSGATAPQEVALIQFNGANTDVRSGTNGSVLTSSTAFTVSTNDIVKLTMRGDTIKMFGGAAGTTQLLCVVDATHTSSGKAGIGTGNFIDTAADISASWHGDDFLVVDQTGQGGDDDCGAGASPGDLGTLLTLGAGPQ